MRNVELSGIIAALPTPFKENSEIDYNEFQHLLEWYMELGRLRGLLINGHAGDVELLTKEERKKCLEITRDTVRKKMEIVAGISGGGLADTLTFIRDAEEIGVNLCLVMIPKILTFGFNDEQVVSFFKNLTRQTKSKIIVYQHPCPNCYQAEALKRIVEENVNIIGVKVTTWVFEKVKKDISVLKSLSRRVSIFTGSDLIIGESFLLGVDGGILGLASLIPESIVELFESVRSGDLKKFLEVNEFVRKVAELVYGYPGSQSTARLRTGLVIRGKLRSDHTRLPILRTPEQEREKLKKLLVSKGLVK